MKKKQQPIHLGKDFVEAYEKEVEAQKELRREYEAATKGVDPNDLDGLMAALFKSFGGK